MTDILMPASFPQTEFRAFLKAARVFFPDLTSNEALFDPQEKLRQFDWSWQAVRYRYKSCAECSDEIKLLLASPSDDWKSIWGDEELMYKVERCIYLFFMSGLSVFDHFAFCLYFFGNALRPDAFPNIATPRVITRKAAADAFTDAFRDARITTLLLALSGDARFRSIDTIRNIVGHRVSGRRSVTTISTAREDGTYSHKREETWHLPGVAKPLVFSENLLEQQLEEITRLLVALSSAAREFAEEQAKKRGLVF